MATSTTAAAGVATAHTPPVTTDASDACRRNTTASAYADAVGGVAIISESGCGSSTAAEKVGDDQRTSSSSAVSEVSSQGNAAAVAAIADLGSTTTTTETTTNNTMTTQMATAVNRKLLLCRRFKDSGGILRNFNSLPLFIYATSNSTHAASADGIGVGREAAAILGVLNDSYELALCTTNTNEDSGGAIECLPLSSAINSTSGSTTLHYPMTTSIATGAANTAVIVGGTPYQHHLNLNHHHHHLLAHHSPYSNNYHLHHSSSHQHIHTEQTKSLQELQNEVGALLEFRDLVIETFPDLKHKMASMSSSSPSSAAASGGGGSVAVSVSGANTLTSNVIISNSSLASRREWEPGIRIKRKLSEKEPSTSAAASGASSGGATGAVPAGIAGELSSSSLSRSRSNSHSGKKEPKSGENNNGSVVQDSGFSTETSSSKDGHSASSTNGAMTGPNASNRLSCPESDDELLNLLDVIHRKSNRLREEVEQLQNYERQNLRCTSATSGNAEDSADGVRKLEGSNDSGGSSATTVGLTPKTFREHVERLNKEDIKQLRKERDRLLDKLAEMEAETLTGRIKAAKMSDQVEELISVKKDLEEQLKLAMAQKLELSSRVQQLQLQQQQQQLQQNSKSSSSQSDYSSQRLNFLSSATTVLSTGSDSSPATGIVPSSSSSSSGNRIGSGIVNQHPNTFQPVVIEQDSPIVSEATKNFLAFHQSASSDSRQLQLPLGRLDGIVSTPGGRNSKCRVTDSKRFQAILLETNVIELQRHLLTLTVQNQVLMQKLDSATKSKTHLVKRLDKSKDDVEDLRFQLEEKNIELEGTKAQLRVLESRMHSSTPSTGTSYTHSQNDYETNRSSASTTLMLSRRGGHIDSHVSDSRSVTPISATIFPPPTTTQISTPSMKAMIHLPMDEIQQHSSSTESAHDLQNELPQSVVNKLMSTSVGGTSPFAQQQHNTSRPQHMKKFGTAAMAISKPSKIPLPGSKAALYFSGKPPTGRPSTAGRSPPSANTSTGSNASSKSSLSRSTGNLLYGKSPNSLKRADSAQSIRKEASSSLSTNTSRSSTSSIPMATTPYSSKTNAGYTTPSSSSRVLQNSPLPKLKRDSLTSRVRHLDSLSRIYQQQQQQQNSNDSNFSSSGGCSSNNTNSAVASTTNGGGGGYLVASTPKTSITAQLRKEMQLSSSNSSGFSHGSQQFLRRATGGNASRSESVGGGNSVAAAATTRRFSSASAVGARIAGRMHAPHDNVGNGASNGGGGGGIATSAGVANNTSEHHNANSVDTDSGKKLTFFNNKNNKFAKLSKTNGKSVNFAENNVTKNTFECNKDQWHDDFVLKNFDFKRHNDFEDITPSSNTTLKEHPNTYFNMPKQSTLKTQQQYIDSNINHKYNCDKINDVFKISNAELNDASWSDNFLGHCSFNSYDEEDKCGSDNFFVTFDYGYSDSIEEEQTTEDFQRNVEKHNNKNFSASCDGEASFDYDENDNTVNYDDDVSDATTADDFDITDEDDDANSASYNQDKTVWFCLPETKDDEAVFQVHYMKHSIQNDEILPKVKEKLFNKYNALGNSSRRNNPQYKYDDDLIYEETAEAENDNEAKQYFYDSLECT